MPDQPDSLGDNKLPDDANDFIRLVRMTRHLFFREGDKSFVYFEICGIDGKLHKFACSVDEIGYLHGNFEWLAWEARRRAAAPGENYRIIPFETVTTITGVMLPIGALLFSFTTPSGHTLQTLIRPELAAQFESQLLLALRTLPKPPVIYSNVSGVTVPGAQNSEKEKSDYFGQSYPTPILKALGVLLIRANLLEQRLVQLLATLLVVENEKAEAMFYSTANLKARIDLVKSVVGQTDLEESYQQQVRETLDKAADVVGQRNDLVHGTWNFHETGFTVESYRPNTKRQRTQIHVTEKSILEIASKYQMVGVALEAYSGSILLKRNMAK